SYALDGDQPWCRSERTRSSRSVSSVVTAPPSPVVTILRGWKEKHATRPRLPQGLPPRDAPSAPAASSSTGRSGSSSRRAGLPNRCTARTAFVRAVTRRAASPGSMFIVTGSTSTSTGFAPTSATTFAVAGKVYAGTSTSSPSPMPSASTATWSAAVPDETAAACVVPAAAASSSSSSRTFGPIVSWPVSRTAAISASSSSPTSGQAKRTWRINRHVLLLVGVASERLRGRQLPASVPRDCPLEALVEVDLRLEAEELPRLADVRAADLDVGVVERLEDDVARAAGEPLDPLRELDDRDDRAVVADVEALADRLRALEAEQHRLHHVVDVAPRADLRAVAVDRQVAAGEGRLDEGADGAAADLAGPVHVEGPHGHRRQVELVVVRVRQVLAREL